MYILQVQCMYCESFDIIYFSIYIAILIGHPGASSETIKNDLRSRFTSRMNEFAFVMILSGTNDLTCRRNGTTSSFNADSIARTIIDIHKYAHSFGRPHRPVYTIAATIPRTYTFAYIHNTYIHHASILYSALHTYILICIHTCMHTYMNAFIYTYLLYVIYKVNLFR